MQHITRQQPPGEGDTSSAERGRRGFLAAAGFLATSPLASKPVAAQWALPGAPGRRRLGTLEVSGL
ncbi:MAG: hypothetical protein EOO29_45525, partial [Comamonadaceae bacterium]